MLFLTQGRALDEDQQYDVYRDAVVAAAPHPVTFRLLDLGGDKVLPMARREANPFLGWRGVRILLDKPDLLRPQLRAVLRAAAASRTRRPRASCSRWSRHRRGPRSSGARSESVCAELDAEGVAHRRRRRRSGSWSRSRRSRCRPTCSPATSTFSRSARTTSRSSRWPSTAATTWWPGSTASSTRPCSALIDQTVARPQAAGIPVSVCGEVAADPRVTPLLVGLGVQTLSASPAYLTLVKRVLRAFTLDEAQDLARRALRQPDADAVRRLLDYFLACHNRDLAELLGLDEPRRSAGPARSPTGWRPGAARLVPHRLPAVGDVSPRRAGPTLVSSRPRPCPTCTTPPSTPTTCAPPSARSPTTSPRAGAGRRRRRASTSPRVRRRRAVRDGRLGDRRRPGAGARRADVAGAVRRQPRVLAARLGRGEDAGGRVELLRWDRGDAERVRRGPGARRARRVAITSGGEVWRSAQADGLDVVDDPGRAAAARRAGLLAGRRAPAGAGARSGRSVRRRRSTPRSRPPATARRPTTETRTATRPATSPRAPRTFCRSSTRASVCWRRSGCGGGRRSTRTRSTRRSGTCSPSSTTTRSWATRPARAGARRADARRRAPRRGRPRPGRQAVRGDARPRRGRHRRLDRAPSRRATSRLARVLSLVQLGDATSFWLAMRKGVDPTPVETIQSLKKHLAVARRVARGRPPRRRGGAPARGTGAGGRGFCPCAGAPVVPTVGGRVPRHRHP